MTLGEIIFNLKARTQNFQQGFKTAETTVGHLQNRVNKSREGLQKFNTTMDKTARGARTASLALFGVATGLGFLVNKTLNAASSAEELKNVLQQSFGSMAQEVSDWAEKQGEAMNRSNYQMKEFVSLNQAILKPMLGSNEQTAKMSKNMTKLAVDIGSFFEVADKQAFEAIQSGMMGMVRPLRRYGIDLTDATIAEYARQRGIKKSTEEMTQAEKVQLRYNYLMENTIHIQGDAIRTAGSYANRKKALTSQIRNLTEAIGYGYIPIAQKIVSVLIEGIKSTHEWIKENSSLTAKIITLSAGFIGLLGIFGTVASGVWMLAKVFGIFGGILSIAISPFFIKMGLLAGVILMVKKAWDKNWGGLQDTVTKIVNWTTKEFDKIPQKWKEIKGIWNDEDLTLGEKTIEIVKIIFPFLEDWQGVFDEKLAAIIDVWNSELLLTEKVIEITNIIFPFFKKWKEVFDEKWDKIKKVWATDESLDEKAVRIVSIIFDLSKAKEKAIKDFKNTVKTWTEDIDWSSVFLDYAIPATIAITAVFAFAKGAAGLYAALKTGLIATGAFVSTAAGVASGSVIAGLGLVGTVAVAIAILALINTVTMPLSEKEKLREQVNAIWKDETMSVTVKMLRISFLEAGLPEIAYIDDLLKESFKSWQKFFSKIGDVFDTFQNEDLGFFEKFKVAGQKLKEAITMDLETWTPPVPETGEIDKATESIENLTNAEKVLLEALSQGADKDALNAIMGIANKESGFNQTDPKTGKTLRGDAGEYGLMQVMPDTGDFVHKNLKGLTEPFSPEVLQDMDKNIEYGVQYFLWQYERYRGDVDKAISAYNAGSAIDNNKAYVDAVKIYWEGPAGDEISGILKEGGKAAGEAWAKGLLDSKSSAEKSAEELAGTVADYLVGHSPTKLGPLSDVDEGGKNVGMANAQGIADGVEEGIPLINTALKKVITPFEGIIANLPDSVRGPIKKLINFLVDISGEVEEGLNSISDLQDKIAELLGKEPDDAAKEVKSLGEVWEGTIRGISDTFEAGLARMINGTGTFRDVINGILTTMQTNFASMVAQIVTDWIKGEIAKAVATEATAATSVAANATIAASNALTFTGLLAWIGTTFATLFTFIESILIALGPIGWLIGIVALWAAISAAKKAMGLTPSIPDNLDEDGPGSGRDSRRDSGRVITHVSGKMRDELLDLLRPLVALTQIDVYLEQLPDLLNKIATINTDILNTLIGRQLNLGTSNLSVEAARTAENNPINIYIGSISDGYTIANVISDVKRQLGVDVNIKNTGKGK